MTWDLAGARFWRPFAQPGRRKPVTFEELYCLVDGTWLKHVWHTTQEPDTWEVLDQRHATLWFVERHLSPPYDLTDWLMENDPMARMIKYGEHGVTFEDCLRWVIELDGRLEVPPELLAITKPIGRIVVDVHDAAGIKLRDEIRDLADRQDRAQETTMPPARKVLPFRPRDS